MLADDKPPDDNDLYVLADTRSDLDESCELDSSIWLVSEDTIETLSDVLEIWDVCEPLSTTELNIGALVPILDSLEEVKLSYPIPDDKSLTEDPQLKDE